MKRPYKRRIIIIKKGLQFRFVIFVVLGMILAALTVGVTHGIILSFVKLKLGNDPKFIELITSVNKVMYLQIVVLIIIGISMALLVSHKIGGPVYRFEKFFDELIKTKDYSKRIKLRRGDELKELADKINKFLDEIERERKE